MDQDYITRAEYLADKENIDMRLQRDFDRLNRLEDDQSALRDMATAVKVQANEMEHLKNDVGNINEKLDEVLAKPGRHWDSLMEKILLVLAGAFVAWLMAGGAGA